MKRGMSLAHGDEEAAAGRGHFSPHFDKRVDGRPVGLSRDDSSSNEKLGVEWCGALERDRELRGHGAGRLRCARRAHQVPRGRPVRMAIEDGAADAPVKDVGKREVMRLGVPAANAGILAFGKAPKAKPQHIGGTATEADGVRSVDLLQAPRLGLGPHPRIALQQARYFAGLAVAGVWVSPLASFLARQAASCLWRRIFCFLRRGESCAVLMGPPYSERGANLPSDPP